MASLEEPTRWSDAGELPETWLGDLSTYRDQGPSEAQVSRMLEALAEPARTDDGAEGALSTKVSPWKWCGAIVAAAFIGLGLWGTLSGSPSEPPASAPTVVTPKATAVTPSSAPTRVEAASEVPASTVESRTMEDRAPHRPVPQRTHVHASGKSNSDPAAELGILTRARRLLASAPEQSLALTDAHRSHYPRGAFAEERELLAIEALVKLSRSAEAQTRGRAFLRVHPGSAHSERVRLLLEPSP
jgi:hypothetical protein